MKRSEFVKIINDVAAAESERIKQEAIDAMRAKDKDGIQNTIAMLAAELPRTSARIAAQIIEKADMIQFEPESLD